jgi:hypothetical protein
LNQQPNFKSISSKFTHGTNKVFHNVVDKWQQDVSSPLKYVTKPKKPWNEFQSGNSSRKLMNNLAVKQIIQVHNQRLSRACIVHLVIKKTNWSYVKTMSCVILELRST